MQDRSLGWEDPLEERMATHSSVPAWRMPQTEQPGRLCSTASHSRTQLKRLSTHSTFSADMILDIENPKESTKKSTS